MLSKRGLELSMTIIVLLIISVLIFVLAIRFGFKFYTESQEIKAEIERSTEQHIEALLQETNALVAIPINKKTVKKGQAATFGLGIRNLANERRQYSVVVSFSNAFYPDERIIQEADVIAVEDRWLGNFKEQSVWVEPREFGIVPLVAKADSSIGPGITTREGTYVFNVCVFDGAPSECSVTNLQQTPEVFYSEKIYQFFIEVI